MENGRRYWQMDKAGKQTIHCQVSTCEHWGGGLCTLDSIEVASPQDDTGLVQVQYATDNPDTESMCGSYKLKKDTIGDVMVY